MIQKCQKCGEWCEADSEASGGTMGGAATGAATGAVVGSILPIIGTAFGGIIGGVAGAIMGSGEEWNFKCPTCEHTWTETEETNDQTEAYEIEKRWKEEILSLVDRTSSLVNSSSKEKANHIKALQFKLSEIPAYQFKSLKAVLYDALAYSQLVLQKDADSALNSIKQSLSLFPKDPTSLAIEGMIYGINDSPLDSYKTMKALIQYKEIDKEESYTHFTIPQFAERFEKLSTNYIDDFLNIPRSNRRFLVVDNSFCYLPDSFVVLPHDRLPHGLSFPQGHPHVQELYVLHPYKPNQYIPYNEYQYSLFRDEVKEFLWIMECLGAKSVSFHETQAEESNVDKEYSATTSGGGEYKGIGGNVSYERGKHNSEYNKLTNELMEIKEYALTPNTPPYIPEDVVWYQHRQDWHRNIESRRTGRLMKASFRLSTSSITKTSTQERKKIEADLNVLLVKANGAHAQEEKISLCSEESHTWAVDVEFYPLTEYVTDREELPLLQTSQTESPKKVNKRSNYIIIGLISLIILISIIAFFM